MLHLKIFLIVIDNLYHILDMWYFIYLNTPYATLYAKQYNFQYLIWILLNSIILKQNAMLRWMLYSYLKPIASNYSYKGSTYIPSIYLYLDVT